MMLIAEVSGMADAQETARIKHTELQTSFASFPRRSEPRTIKVQY
jgi:hypothetical protein